MAAGCARGKKQAGESCFILWPMFSWETALLKKKTKPSLSLVLLVVMAIVLVLMETVMVPFELYRKTF